MLFVTYGDRNFHNSKKALCNEAYEFGFRKFLVSSPENLDQEFLVKHREFFDRSPRGAGYWLWKPYIVNEGFKLINYGEFLLYADAGCTVNLAARNRFMQWIQMADIHGSLSFQMCHLEKHWTKMNLSRFMNCQDDKILNTGQLIATTFLLKKTEENVKMIEEWLKLCELEWSIDDSSSDISNDKDFREHRHDQSVFSLLRKRMNCFSIEDETYPLDHNWNSQEIKRVPIHATRRKF